MQVQSIIQSGVTGFVNFIISLLDQIRIFAKKVLSLVGPIVGLMIVTDIVGVTTFGILDKSLLALTKVGISGNVLTIILVVAVYIYLDKKKA